MVDRDRKLTCKCSQNRNFSERLPFISVSNGFSVTQIQMQLLLNNRFHNSSVYRCLIYSINSKKNTIKNMPDLKIHFFCTFNVLYIINFALNRMEILLRFHIFVHLVEKKNNSKILYFKIFLNKIKTQKLFLDYTFIDQFNYKIYKESSISSLESLLFLTSSS